MPSLTRALADQLAVGRASVSHTAEETGGTDVPDRMNLLYVAGHSDLGASQKFGKAALGLMVAWALNYMSVRRQNAGARADASQILAPV